MRVTRDDVQLLAEAGSATDVKDFAVEAMRNGDKTMALFLLRSVKDAQVDRDRLFAWLAEQPTAVDRFAVVVASVPEKSFWDRLAANPITTVSVHGAPSAPFDDEECDLCGEAPDAEMAEFVDLDGGPTIAHALCGRDAGLELA